MSYFEHNISNYIQNWCPRLGCSCFWKNRVILIRDGTTRVLRVCFWDGSPPSKGSLPLLPSLPWLSLHATYHHDVTTCVSHSLYAVGLERWRDKFKVHDLQRVVHGSRKGYRLRRNCVRLRCQFQWRTSRGYCLALMGCPAVMLYKNYTLPSPQWDLSSSKIMALTGEWWAERSDGLVTTSLHK